MMAVFLLGDDVIAGVPRNAGELVTVPDDYDADNVARVVRRNVQDTNRQRAARQRAAALEKRRGRKEKPGRPTQPGKPEGVGNGRR